MLAAPAWSARIWTVSDCITISDHYFKHLLWQVKVRNVHLISILSLCTIWLYPWIVLSCYWCQFIVSWHRWNIHCWQKAIQKDFRFDYKKLIPVFYFSSATLCVLSLRFIAASYLVNKCFKSFNFKTLYMRYLY